MFVSISLVTNQRDVFVRRRTKEHSLQQQYTRLDGISHRNTNKRCSNARTGARHEVGWVDVIVARLLYAFSRYGDGRAK